MLELPIAKVEPRDNQPRTVFDEEALSELAESIREYGVIQPVTVRKLDSGYYQLIAGERRWRAARLVGLTEIPARVIEGRRQADYRAGACGKPPTRGPESCGRSTGYRTLMEEYGLTQDEAAQRVGKSRPAVANALRLLSLAPEVLQFVEQGLLSADTQGHLSRSSPEELQIDAARQVIKNGLSVRRTEELAKRLMRAPSPRLRTTALYGGLRGRGDKEAREGARPPRTADRRRAKGPHRARILRRRRPREAHRDPRRFE